MHAISTVGALRMTLTTMAARYHTRRLQVARGIWFVTVPLSLAVFIAALPARYHQLRAETIHDRLQLARPHSAALLPPLAAWLTSQAYAPAILGLEVLVMLVCAATAVLIFWRRNDERIAIVASLDLVGYGVLFLPPLDALAATYPAWSMLVRVVQACGLEVSLLLLYVSPDGHFIPRWTRLLTIIWTLWTAASVVFPSAPFNFLHGRPHIATPQVFGLPWLLACLAWYGTGLLAQVVRYRRVSTPQQRQQTKWVVIGWAAVVAFYTLLVLPRVTIAALSVTGPLDLLYRRVGVPSFEAVLLLSPIPITISVLRYRLWDVDAVINRALVYSLVTGALATIYAISTIVLQAGFQAVTRQGSALAAVGSTLAIAALFQPVRSRIQRGVDCRFYRRKYDAARLVKEFGLKLRDEVELDALLDKLVGVVDESMQPAHVSVVLLPARTATQPAGHVLDFAKVSNSAIQEARASTETHATTARAMSVVGRGSV